MKSAKIIGTLGIIVALLPYAGIPGAWYRPMVLVAGAAIAFLALRTFFKPLPHVPDRTMSLPFDSLSHGAAAHDVPSVHAH
jgi:hypothetical protein